MNEKVTITVKEARTLYFLMGEALCSIQLLEAALSCSLTLKKDVKYPHGIPKDEADLFLEKYGSYVLGRVIEITKKTGFYSENILRGLEFLREERNWLVHKCLPEYMDKVFITSDQIKHFDRVKGITIKAKQLQKTIEADLMNFSESKGLDMSRVRAQLGKNYFE